MECAKLFIDLIQHFLSRTRLLLIQDQLQPCFKIVSEIDPWFPDKGTIVTKFWKRIKDNVYSTFKGEG